MIQILKDHTTLIGDLKTEMTNVSSAVRKLIATADDNKKIIANVLEKVETNKKAMDTIHNTLLEYKIDIVDIQGRIECLPEMKENIQVGYHYHRPDNPPSALTFGINDRTIKSQSKIWDPNFSISKASFRSSLSRPETI